MNETELEAMAEKVDSLHRAFFEVPPGSPRDEKPLVEGLRIVWRSYQRGSWLTRIVVWGVPATVAVGAGVTQLWGWVSWTK